MLLVGIFFILLFYSNILKGWQLVEFNENSEEINTLVLRRNFQTNEFCGENHVFYNKTSQVKLVEFFIIFLFIMGF
jgi:hypothetical protein